MSSDARYLGDVWPFKFGVIDPEGEEALALEGEEEEPTVIVVRPDHTEFEYGPEEVEGNEYLCLIRLTQVGPWRAIVKSRPPFDDTEVLTTYASPVRDS